MSLYGSLSQQDISLSKSSAEYSDAAYTHVHVSLFLIVGSVVLMFFFGWGWLIIPFLIGIYMAVKSLKETISAMKIEHLRNRSGTGDDDFFSIVQAYGQALASLQSKRVTVADASKLPHGKEKTKAALIAAMRSTDDKQMKRYLANSYLHIAKWQEGVGKTKHSPDPAVIKIPQNRAQITRENQDKTTESTSWRALVNKEQQALEQELRDSNLWVD